MAAKPKTPKMRVTGEIKFCSYNRPFTPADEQWQDRLTKMMAAAKAKPTIDAVSAPSPPSP